MNIVFIGDPIELVYIIISIGIIGVSLTTIIGFLGRFLWTFDLFSHFRVQYLVILTGFTLLSFLFDRIIISIIGLTSILINLLTIFPYYIPGHKPVPGTDDYRILLSNVLRPNRDFEKLLRIIQEIKPDIMVLIEVNDQWLDELAQVTDKYPYIHTAIRSDNYGIAIFSRYAFSNAQTIYFSDANVPSLVADVNIDGQQVILIGTHPPPPKSKIENTHRNQQIENIADFIVHQNKSTILLGDLNMTSWSSKFKELTNGTELHDTRIGYGLQPTWPTHNPFIMVPIDHILVSADISVHNRFTGPDMGSDHLPVIVDFSIGNNTQGLTG